MIEALTRSPRIAEATLAISRMMTSGLVSEGRISRAGDARRPRGLVRAGGGETAASLGAGEPERLAEHSHRRHS